MAYIGNEPRFQNYPSKFFNGDGTAMTVTLDYAPPSASAILVFVSGVRRDTSEYTLNGTSLTFTGTVTSGTNNVQVIHLAQVSNTVTPIDGSVTPVKLANTAVTPGSYTAASVTVDQQGRLTAASSGESVSAWQSVKTTSFVAVAGQGYPVNTTSGELTCTLPASASVGDTIEIVDYAGTFDTNNLLLNPNSLNLKGASSTLVLKYDRQGVKLVYVDATQGWVAVTGINETNPAISVQPASIDYIVVSGGGSGGLVAGNGSGPSSGGGAGGLRSGTSLQLSSSTVYTATVGAGAVATCGTGVTAGTDGSASSLAGSDITTVVTVGGGGGGSYNGAGRNGGSGGGGGGGGANAGGSGTAGEGNDGGVGHSATGAGGGGGSGAVGAAGTSGASGAGGAGTANSITGSSVTYAGGGGGGGSSTATVGAGGSGGGGAGAPEGENGVDGTDGLGGGGGGSGTNDVVSGLCSGAGGDGIVIIRMLTSQYTGTVTGSPTVTTDGDYKVVKFTSTGTYTA